MEIGTDHCSAGLGILRELSELQMAPLMDTRGSLSAKFRKQTVAASMRDKVKSECALGLTGTTQNPPVSGAVPTNATYPWMYLPRMML